MSLLEPAHPGSPGQMALKWLCVCVCVCVCADNLKLYTCYKVDMLHNDLHTAVNRLTEWAKLGQL